MAQVSLQTAEKPSQAVGAKITLRLFFVDHLRAALVILVVLHHLAVVYGEGISFWYVDPPKSPSLWEVCCWFCSCFSTRPGSWAPFSCWRAISRRDHLIARGSGSFLKDRLIRLGIPLAHIHIRAQPDLKHRSYSWSRLPGYSEPLTWQNFWQHYPEFIGLGVAWFVAMLLIFSFGYAAWRMADQEPDSSSARESSPPSYLGIGIFILALALVTYLVRIVVPIGKSVLDFPTLAYLPQYLSFFIVGTVAYRRDWFRTVPGSMGKVGFVTAVVATLFLFPIPLLGILRRHHALSGQWELAVCRLCALGLHLRSRHVSGRDHILPPLFQREEQVRQLPVPTELCGLRDP